MPSSMEKNLKEQIKALEKKIKALEKSSSSSSSSRSKKKSSSSRSKKKSPSSSSKQRGFKLVPRTPDAIRRIGPKPLSTSRSPGAIGFDKKDDRGPDLLEEGIRVYTQPNIHALKTPSEANEAWNKPGPGPDPGKSNFNPLWAIKQGVVRTGKSPKKKKKKKNKNKKKKKTVHKRQKRN